MKLALRYVKSIEKKERSVIKFQTYIDKTKQWIAEDTHKLQQVLNKMDEIEFIEFGNRVGYLPERQKVMTE